MVKKPPVFQAGCGESRTPGPKRGKACKGLPIAMGYFTNAAAANLNHAEYNRLIAGGIGYDELHITPSPDVLVNANQLFVPIRRLLTAGAVKVARQLQEEVQG